MKSQLNTPNHFRIVVTGVLLLACCLFFSGCSQQMPVENDTSIIATGESIFENPVIETTNSSEKMVESLLNAIEIGGIDNRNEIIDKLVELGSPAVEPLIITLQQGDYTAKRVAAQALGQIKDIRAVEPLILALQDEYSFVREDAVEALGLIQDKRAVGPLIAALNDKESSVGEKGAKALGEIGDPSAVESLIEAMFSDDPFVSQNAIIALGKIKDARAVEPLMKVFLAEETYDKRYAKQALVMIGAPAVDGIISALKDDDNEIRAQAVAALGEIKDSRAVEPLIEYMKLETYNDRYSVCAALVMIGEPAVEPLVAALEDENTELRAYAVRALGGIKDARAIDPLIKVLQDEDFYYNYWAAIALGEIKDERAIEPLIASLKGYNQAIQNEAKNSLVKIGLPAVDPLIEALKNEDAGIREYSVLSLAEIKDPRAVEPLIAMLQDEDFYVRQRVPQALAQFNDPRVVEPLISSLQDKWSAVRMAAADALSIIKDARSVKPLISALVDDDPYVIRQAARALAEIQDGQAIEPLIAVLSFEEPIAQMAAAEALARFNDPRAADTLINGYRDEKLEIIAGAYAYFIKRGENGSEPLLIEALNKYGDTQMAEDFLNCGNQLLDEAGIKWAAEHNYPVITSSYVNDNPIWGSNH